MQRLILVRHGTALKNLADKHGGEGTNLAAIGRNELALLATHFVERGLRPNVIYAAPVPQAYESASYLGASYDVRVTTTKLLRPLYLGVLDGLSNDEAESRHPAAASSMAAWRRGELEICNLHIPQAEKTQVFYERGQKFLDSVQDSDGTIMVVGTRSILILLISILLGRKPVPGGGYKEIPIGCCDFFTFEPGGGRFVLNPELSLGQLEYLS